VSAGIGICEQMCDCVHACVRVWKEKRERERVCVWDHSVGALGDRDSGMCFAIVDARLSDADDEVFYRELRPVLCR
jgi:hypothetical protein